MHERSPIHVLTVAAVTALMMTSGCISAVEDAFGDEELTAQGAQTASVAISAENTTQELSHLGLSLDAVFVHNASIEPPEGYFELNTTEHADLVTDGEAGELLLASRTLPEGTYDQVVLRVDQTAVEAAGQANASADGNDSAEENESDGHDHDHDDGHGHGDANASNNSSADGNESDGHDHDHGEESAGGNDSEGADESQARAKSQAGFDIPINVTFEVTADASTGVILVLDAGASTAGDSFTPVFTRVEVTQDGEVVEKIDEPDVGFREATKTTPTSTLPPAARMEVFNEEGDKLNAPDFIAKSGTFVNSLSDPLPVNMSVGFSASKSEAVEDGATLEAFDWDFGDNVTGTGANVEHTYEAPGAYNVSVTVTDSFGATAQHHLKVVVANWTEVALNTSFEEGEGNWTVETSCCGTMTSWALDGDGHESETAWHAGTHGPVNEVVGAETISTTTLISPNITVPENWTTAGYVFQTRGMINGAGLCCPPAVQISYDVFENGSDEASTQQVESFGESEPDWIEVGSMTAFEEADTDIPGKTVRFKFTFDTSFWHYNEGEGWFVDDFQIGGIPEDDFQNAELLEGGGHGGHDHEH